ncbi:MAG: c-type cytochrome [Gemmatimonadota bacterium]|nr:c-type cytochrome [Gemmatimonadota bacterium]
MLKLFLALSLTVALTSMAVGSLSAQEQPVTKAMIDQGASLFAERGLCYACHGPEGKGIPNLGVDLTDDEWLHSDGSFEGVLETIMQGVSPDRSSSGTMMPPKGGSSLSNDQIKAVAAYVWSLTNKP